MVKHIVFMKFNNFSEATIVKNQLLTLPAIIPQMKEMEVGIDFARSKRSFDLALTVVLNNTDDLNIYAKHPEHLKVLEYINSVKLDVVAVDYEF